jgi:hypothetical protein
MDDKKFFAVLDALHEEYKKYRYNKIFKIDEEEFHQTIKDKSAYFREKFEKFEKNGYDELLHIENHRDIDIQLAMVVYSRIMECEKKFKEIKKKGEQNSHERENLIEFFTRYLELQFLMDHYINVTFYKKIYEKKLSDLDKKLAETISSFDEMSLNNPKIINKNGDKAQIDLKQKQFKNDLESIEEEAAKINEKLKDYDKYLESVWVKIKNEFLEGNDGHFSESQSKADAPDQKLNEITKAEHPPKKTVDELVKLYEKMDLENSRKSNNTERKNFTKKRSRGFKM